MTNVKTEPKTIDGVPVEVVTSCALCGDGAANQVLQIGGWRIEFCARCGLGRTNPRAAEHKVAQLYDPKYFTAKDSGEPPSDHEAERAIRHQAKRVRHMRKVATAGRLLEIGPGFGFFCEAAKRNGFEVEALEISEWAAEQARRRYGLTAHTGTVDAFDPHGKTYDVIAMFHVLEHVSDPLVCLRRLRSWLNPRGAVIIEVPNCASDDARGQGQSWGGWQPRYHFWHFKPETLCEVLRRAGFEPGEMQFARSEYVRHRLKRIPVLGLFRSCFDCFYHGDWMRIVARALPNE